MESVHVSGIPETSEFFRELELGDKEQSLIFLSVGVYLYRVRLSRIENLTFRTARLLPDPKPTPLLRICAIEQTCCAILFYANRQWRNLMAHERLGQNFNR